MKSITIVFICWIAVVHSALSQTTIIYPENASFSEELAAKELKKYIYLRTGELLDIQAAEALPSAGDIILVATDDHPMVKSLASPSAPEGGFILKTVESSGRQVLVVAGEDSTTTLYAAYRYAEQLGLGFDLAGDIIPDAKIELDISGVDEKGVPMLNILGIQPFHDFHQGPDFWSTADYQAIISQLPKLGMNFIGFHNYPRYSTTEERDVNTSQGPELNVWIGLPEDVNDDGTVKWAYPAYYAHTHRPNRIWGFATRNTSQFHAGAHELFAENSFGSEVLATGVPTDPASSRQVFNRTGQMFNQAFSHARHLGVKTALGTELPLGLEPKGPEVGYDWVRGMPPELQARLENKGLAPQNPQVVKEVYKGIFERIMKTHLLDYYWLWSWEVWSNYGVSNKQIKAFKTDIKLAEEALQELGNPFQLGLAGWRIGTVDNHAEFDNILPAEAPFFGLWDEAEGMEDLRDERIKWAATWAEEDWGLAQPQLELHRIYNDAKAAWEKKTDGLIAKHWRTRIIGANIASMKDLLWSYGPTGNPISKTLPADKNAWIDAFYLDWATRQFGPEAAPEIAALFAALDKAGEPGSEGAVPVVMGWDTEIEEGNNGAPGAITWVENDWEEEQKKFAFVDQLEALHSRIKGAGNRYRFDYWLKSMQAFRLMGQYGAHRFQFEGLMEANDYAAALKQRIEMARLFEQIMTLEIEKAINTSDLGEIVNLEILNWYQLMMLKWDEKLEKGLGRAIPAEANPSTDYQGAPFIRATPLRTQIYRGEDYKLKVWVMGKLAEPTLYWRPLGKGPFRAIPIEQMGRSVYEVAIPTPAEDFEYYLEAASGEGKAVFPAAAPDINAAVTVLEIP